ncbi:response regulator [Mucilaginibacter achroorhodeus]|uniref:Response regulator n=1 Tax=Mucilaginibacter achroorhodeus TaxID=2599294 RepID=A0A563UB58_9SPHI|nr:MULTISPECIES: response regulator [Mucilaginibacter]QXV66322.1 response regulator [Mucilaginibacter sp. 21P]TWR28556.1 response regulator [Mucilaginibacter achroorhodeus]
MPNKILICDDDEGILDLLELVLTDEGYSVVAELNSVKVSNLIQKEHPDLIILDLWMPVTSGDQILKTIRNTPAISELPVIVISASNDGKAIAQEAGATAFISKPFDIDEMTGKVNEILSSAQAK